MISEINQQQANLATLCLRYRVRQLQLFGLPPQAHLRPPRAIWILLPSSPTRKLPIMRIATLILPKRWKNYLTAASMY